jgi:hypothetical protein
MLLARRAQTGKGLIKAAVEALIDEGFQQLKLNRFKRGVALTTIEVRLFAIVRVLKKEGFCANPNGITITSLT